MLGFFSNILRIIHIPYVSFIDKYLGNLTSCRQFVQYGFCHLHLIYI